VNRSPFARDPILDIDRTSRSLVSQLQSQGYQVQLVEFDGGHEVPADISTHALSWLAADWSPP
jgi:phospholipase/carboxylesterase